MLIDNKKRALIAMSGGVDSSVAAKIMLDEGYECIGCTMKLFHNEDVGISRQHTCCSLDDVEDARSVAYALGMKHYVFNFSDDFNEKIIEKFVSSYEAGITPNPCIDCNRYMKFDKLYQRATILNCEYVVTGHYARIEYDAATDNFLLKKAVDDTKDQSYVLYSMTQEQLRHTKFPLGGFSKSETREIAKQSGFVNAQKADSQDICFVPNGDYAAVIEQNRGTACEPGNFVDKNGEVLGRHKGIIRYTVGQRRGLGISFPKPMYVIGIRASENEVVLGEEEDLFQSELDASDVNWISGTAPAEVFRCKVKIRYRKPEEWATVIPTGDKSVHIIFDEPQRAITPGQAAVMYQEDIVLGGGTIEMR